VPVKEGTGRIARFELLPLEALGGRPRVDVLCNMSGIFRDAFQVQGWTGEGRVIQHAPLPAPRSPPPASPLARRARPPPHLCRSAAAPPPAPSTPPPQNVVELLDDLFARAASADEDPERNYIRKHALAMQAAGVEARGAAARLFSNPAGDYGSMVNERVGASNWESSGELGDVSGRCFWGGLGGRRAAGSGS
jgi:hypothetical protein